MPVRDLFFFALGNQHDNTSLSLAAGPTHALNQSYWTLVSIKTDYQIHISNVQTFLPNTCRHQSVVATFTKLSHHLQYIG